MQQLDLKKAALAKIDEEHAQALAKLRGAQDDVTHFEALCQMLADADLEFTPDLTVHSWGIFYYLRLDMKQSEQIAELMIKLAGLGCDLDETRPEEEANSSGQVYLGITSVVSPDFEIVFYPTKKPARALVHAAGIAACAEAA